MVSTMNVNTKEICDNPQMSHSAISHKAVALKLKQSTSADQDLSKLTLNLKLATTPTEGTVKQQMIKKLKSQDSMTSTGSSTPRSPTSMAARKTKTDKMRKIRSISEYSMSGAEPLPFAVKRKQSKLKKQDSLKSNPSLSSGASASSGAGKSSVGSRSIISTQTSITTPSQVDVVDDRKALRDALYQGIFSRHIRTFFAVGSFLRMLKGKNSHQYNTIRSTSEHEDEIR